MTQVPSHGHYETRAEVIWRYVRRLTRSTRTSLADYSEMVRLQWHQLPETLRGADFSDHPDILKRMKANEQKLARWMRDDVSARPSIDVEDVLVIALPAPYRAECMAELTARWGGLFVDMPHAAALQLGNAGELLRNCGEALQALGPVFADDNKISAADSRQDLLRARKELLEVSASVSALVAQIDAAIDQQDAEQTKAVPLLRGAA